MCFQRVLQQKVDFQQKIVIKQFRYRIAKSYSVVRDGNKKLFFLMYVTRAHCWRKDSIFRCYTLFCEMLCWVNDVIIPVLSFFLLFFNSFIHWWEYRCYMGFVKVLLWLRIAKSLFFEFWSYIVVLIIWADNFNGRLWGVILFPLEQIMQLYFFE